jgi:hypothetical protein
VKTQSNELIARATKAGKEVELKKLAEAMNRKLTTLEEEMIQTKNKAGQDPINYPPMFDDQLDWLYLVVNTQDARPTKGCYDLYDDLKKQSDGFMKRLDDILASDLKLFNEQVVKENVGGVLIEGLK